MYNNVVIGYRFVVDSIRIMRRPDNRPTGEAYIMFETFDDATLALEQRQRGMMDKRYIELFRAAPGEIS